MKKSFSKTVQDIAVSIAKNCEGLSLKEMHALTAFALNTISEVALEKEIPLSETERIIHKGLNELDLNKFDE